MAKERVDRGGASIGVNGCLFGAVALFVILLIGLFIISIFRFSQPPQGPPGLPGAPTAPRSALPAPLPALAVALPWKDNLYASPPSSRNSAEPSVIRDA